MVHRWSLMCANHIDMIAHTPAFFTELGTTRIYVKCSTAGPKSHITLWSNASRTVTHPCINQAHDCLTSVIKHKTFAPCYVSPWECGDPCNVPPHVKRIYVRWQHLIFHLLFTLFSCMAMVNLANMLGCRARSLPQCGANSYISGVSCTTPL